jgi:phosphoribosylanthranilate isomerase
MFRVKICGVTRPMDAQLALEAGADAIGLNFYHRSKRYVTLAQAKNISDCCAGAMQLVGVFVDASPSEILRTAEQVRLAAVQMHGDEPPEAVAQLRGMFVIRSMRLNGSQWNDLMHYLQRCGELDAMPGAVLLDAAVPNALGGTGQRADWDLARAYAQTRGLPPLVLAGGLTPENVATAIEQVRPAAVDVASGVESEPRRLCRERVYDFVRAAQFALTRLEAHGSTG